MLRNESSEKLKLYTLLTKWRQNYKGPLRIIEVMGPLTYKIELSPSMKRAHDVFHVFKLKKLVRRDGDTEILDIVVDSEGTTEQESAQLYELI